MVKIKIKRVGFRELSPRALAIIEKSLREIFEGKVRPLEELIKELESSD